MVLRSKGNSGGGGATQCMGASAGAYTSGMDTWEEARLSSM